MYLTNIYTLTIFTCVIYDYSHLHITQIIHPCNLKYLKKGKMQHAPKGLGFFFFFFWVSDATLKFCMHHRFINFVSNFVLWVHFFLFLLSIVGFNFCLLFSQINWMCKAWS
jgi:hypothetical protein